MCGCIIGKSFMGGRSRTGSAEGANTVRASFGRRVGLVSGSSPPSQSTKGHIRFTPLTPAGRQGSNPAVWGFSREIASLSDVTTWQWRTPETLTECVRKQELRSSPDLVDQTEMKQALGQRWPIGRKRHVKTVGQIRINLKTHSDENCGFSVFNKFLWIFFDDGWHV